MPRISDLPEEIIHLLFSYLSLADRKNARLVCRQWSEIASAVSLTKDDITVVSEYSNICKLNVKKRYRNIKVKQLHCKEVAKGDIDATIRFWKECGQHIKSLELYQADLYDTRLKDMFCNTPNLEYLLISQYDENDKFTQLKHSFRTQPKNLDAGHFIFPKLLSLDLLHFQNSSIYGFTENLNSVIAQAPLLKRLSLEWFGIKQQSDLPKEFLVNFAKSHCKTLKELNLSRTTLEYKLLQPMFSEIGPQLTGLYLRGCKQLKDDSLPVIASRFPNLKELDLSLCPFSDLSLHSLLTALQNLTHISLTKSNIGPISLPIISERPNLIAVELSYSKYITSESIVQAFGTKLLPKIVDLRLDKLKVTDFVLQEIIENVPKLTYLYLNDCQVLAENGLSLICKHLGRLRSLSIRNWVKLRDVSCINDIKGLVHLDLYGCRNATNESITKLALLELQTLDLSCTNVSAQGCKGLISQCPSMQDVYIDLELEDHLLKFVHPTNLRFKFHFGLAHFTADSIFDI